MLQESNRVEFKAALNDKLEKEIVVFLNNREGGRTVGSGRVAISD